MTRLIPICFALLPLVLSIPVDNEVVGEPEIECGPTSITINANVRNEFTGHVFVKGLYNDATCRNDATGSQIATISLPFDTCNVQRTRSLNPRGIFVSTTVVISFHPQFVTKVDRAYRIQCFYMESDKTVSQDIAVSDLTTGFATVAVPMPICRYDILEGGPNGEPINFALVGQQVYHKWTCESETIDTFCMVVHSCTVDDGNGDTIQILDDKGCALDKFVLNNLEYPADLVAGQEAHVYKYADREQLFYQCQISITIKEPNGECARPECSEPTGFNAVSLNGATGLTELNAEPEAEPEPTTTTTTPAPPAPFARGGRRPAGRGKREVMKREAQAGEAILDVRAELAALEVNADTNLRALLHLAEDGSSPKGFVVREKVALPSVDYCLSPFSFVALLAVAFFVTLSLLTLLVVNVRAGAAPKKCTN
ncbi:cut-1 [Pristionchus pacificus]|uniref:Cut-1 n=1 Tax=Pristionchus pacificus TaxID=54126 RepID=A0A2A6CGU9_PRIPA|nr:cut-1 [Pristionchus pacificus]|eukprot:PDM77308.1 cut-1 [Pristionchus pacificus]